jgi:molybdopterin/thiamine biosynthesis adenylyltransferase
MSQNKRYSRNTLVPQIGEAGQRKLAQSRVAVLGQGGLGSPAAYYLAAAGVGRLTLIDHDTVEVSNLQRQILHDTSSLGQPKSESARRRLESLNPDIEIQSRQQELTRDNAAQLLAGQDFVLECSDNFAAKFAINQACVALGIPYSHAGVQGLSGQSLTVIPGQGPCLRCLFPEELDDSWKEQQANLGILGSIAGIMGSLQATEALKYLLGIGKPLEALLLLEGPDMSWRKIELERNPQCPACGSSLG